MVLKFLKCIDIDFWVESPFLFIGYDETIKSRLHLELSSQKMDPEMLGFVHLFFPHLKILVFSCWWKY